MRGFARGQSLLETTIVLGVLFVAVAVGAGAALVLTGNERPSQARLIALDEAGNAATELLAATAYDPAALAHVVAAEWNAGPVALSSRVHRAGGAQIVDLHYVNGSAAGDISLSLRPATVPPGAVIDATATAPPAR
jgi:hypothetical protein